MDVSFRGGSFADAAIYPLVMGIRETFLFSSFFFES